MTIAGSTEYYLQLLDEAKAYARLQGFRGARWFKMRGAQTLTVYTGPSAVGPLLLQEQPHPIVVSAATFAGLPAALPERAVAVRSMRSFSTEPHRRMRNALPRSRSTATLFKPRLTSCLRSFSCRTVTPRAAA